MRNDVMTLGTYRLITLKGRLDLPMSVEPIPKLP